MAITTAVESTAAAASRREKPCRHCDGAAGGAQLHQGKSQVTREHQDKGRRGIQLAPWEVALLCALVDIRQHLARQRSKQEKKED